VPSAPSVSFREPHAKGVLNALLNCFSFCFIMALVSLSLFPSTVHCVVELVGSSLVFVGMRGSLMPGPLPLPMCCWHFRYMSRFSSWRCNCKRVLVFWLGGLLAAASIAAANRSRWSRLYYMLSSRMLFSVFLAALCSLLISDLDSSEWSGILAKRRLRSRVVWFIFLVGRSDFLRLFQ
jgi:hypothetical protein